MPVHVPEPQKPEPFPKYHLAARAPAGTLDYT